MAVKPPPGAMEIRSSVPGLMVFMSTRMALLVVVEVLTDCPGNVASFSNHDPNAPEGNFLERFTSFGVASKPIK